MKEAVNVNHTLNMNHSEKVISRRKAWLTVFAGSALFWTLAVAIIYNLFH